MSVPQPQQGVQAGGHALAMPKQTLTEVNWETLDKTKFFVVGAGLFSGVTTLLFPFSVIKTRQMASSDVSSGFQGVTETSRRIWQEDGVRGFYRGFSTVLLGALPSRVLYLTTLEYTKSVAAKTLHPLGLSDTAAAATSNFVGAGVASVANQALIVPVDVISQRQMMHGAASTRSPASPTPAPTPPATPAPSPTRATSTAPTHSGKNFTTAATASSTTKAPTPPGAVRQQHVSGMQMARTILQQEGIAGLYRGFGASLLLYAPSGAVWWGCYGAYQHLIWSTLPSPATPALQPPTAPTAHVAAGSSAPSVTEASTPMTLQTPGRVIAVQTVSSVAAGVTSSLLTNPLDLIKTRLQVAEADGGRRVPRAGEILQEVLQTEGPRGLLRGALPRAMNSVLFGTVMVSVYEFLKRICAMPQDGQQEASEVARS